MPDGLFYVLLGQSQRHTRTLNYKFFLVRKNLLGARRPYWSFRRSCFSLHFNTSAGGGQLRFKDIAACSHSPACCSLCNTVGASPSGQCSWYFQHKAAGLAQVVHGTGMQTHVGTWVWVTWVWVRVQHEVPVQNPYLHDGFGGYFQGTIILSTATVQLMPPKISSEVDYCHNGSGSIKTHSTTHNGL